MGQNAVDMTKPEYMAPQTPQSIGVRKKRWVVCFENTILDLDLSIYEKMVYIVLCAHARKDGPCYPSVKKIAEEASCSRTKVFEALKTLEERGIIVRSSQIYQGRGQTSNLYEIVDIEPRPQGEPPRPCDGRPDTADEHRSPRDGRGSTQGEYPPSATGMGPVREPDAVEQGNNKQDHKNNTKEQKSPPTPQGAGDGDDNSQNSKPQSPKHDTEANGESAKPTGSSPESIHAAILTAYNEILPELPRADSFTASRCKTLNLRISEDSARQEPDWWNRYFERVRLFPWLMGNNPNNWRASFDWLTGEDGMRKVIEGSFSQVTRSSQCPKDTADKFRELQERYTDERGFVNAKALLRDWKAKTARTA